jgi:hypothetical protein
MKKKTVFVQSVKSAGLQTSSCLFYCHHLVMLQFSGVSEYGEVAHSHSNFLMPQLRYQQDTS